MMLCFSQTILTAVERPQYTSTSVMHISDDAVLLPPPIIMRQKLVSWMAEEQQHRITSNFNMVALWAEALKFSQIVQTKHLVIG